jgi:hypothetical protein
MNICHHSSWTQLAGELKKSKTARNPLIMPAISFLSAKKSLSERV